MLTSAGLWWGHKERHTAASARSRALGDTMSKRLAALFAILSCCSAACWADAPPAAPVSSHTQAAIDLLHVTNVDTLIQQQTQGMVDAMVQQNAQLAPYSDVIKKWAETYISWKELGPQIRGAVRVDLH